MTVETAVTLSPSLALFGFLGVVLLLLVLIAKWKWHVFIALLVPLLIFGLLPGIQTNNFIAAFETGFGSTLGSIGVVIVLGSIMSEALRHTGAIKTITRSMVRLVGAKRMPLALSLSGFVLGIAIFSDVAYVILNPLVHSAARVMSAPIAVTATGLVGALQLTHAIVPPTPGPLAAAAIVGADIGKTIIYGSLACLVGTLCGWIWGQYIAGPRIPTLPSMDHADDSYFSPTKEEAASQPPGLMASYAPILVPVALISAQSLSRLFFEEGHIIRDGLAYIGWPVIALSIGVLLAYRNISTLQERAAARGSWIEEGLKTSAMILVVTGLGGSLSEILKNTPAVEMMAEMFTHYQLPVILLPFLIGVIGNMITGSTTVGVITAASIVSPMLESIALSPEAAMLSGAAGRSSSNMSIAAISGSARP
ncbi:gluconate permease [Iodidimonas nitroreducens]|uniref:Gluconate permease n=1 Tax=Iodidimonas nitroreducens TaxID=1236968 RepID=A0A5A7N7X4_9PROT|nr:SLC13 family permease [Iodidimonas nitroreducens]GER04188.1 gluconate permease [Iodidimonas nitroreducens]